MIIGTDSIGVSVGALILNNQKQLLLTKRSQKAKNEKGCWEAPGGEVDFGEKLETAIKREIQEELGIEITILLQFPAENHLIPKEAQHWVATTFLCEVASNQKPVIKEPDKCEAFGWYSLDSLPRPLSLITQEDIKKLKKINLSVPPGIYKHFKGQTYQVLNVARHSESLEEYVVYQPLYTDPASLTWIRPKQNFEEQVHRKGKKVQRFIKL